MIAADAYVRRDDLENARRMWRQGISVNSQNPDISRAYVAWMTVNQQESEAPALARRLTHQPPASLRGWPLYRAPCLRPNPELNGNVIARREKTKHEKHSKG